MNSIFIVEGHGFSRAERRPPILVNSEPLKR
jgi:hypothetical protein